MPPIEAKPHNFGFLADAVKINRWGSLCARFQRLRVQHKIIELVDLDYKQSRGREYQPPPPPLPPSASPPDAPDNLSAPLNCRG